MTRRASVCVFVCLYALTFLSNYNTDGYHILHLTSTNLPPTRVCFKLAISIVWNIRIFFLNYVVGVVWLAAVLPIQQTRGLNTGPVLLANLIKNNGNGHKIEFCGVFLWFKSYWNPPECWHIEIRGLQTKNITRFGSPPPLPPLPPPLAFRHHIAWLAKQDWECELILPSANMKTKR